eukprot:m.17269 g.17269  ORF g.17269 m.17269 type:complete len:303 (+) comp27404_c0_seq2:50-958(+)
MDDNRNEDSASGQGSVFVSRARASLPVTPKKLSPEPSQPTSVFDDASRQNGQPTNTSSTDMPVPLQQKRSLKRQPDSEEFGDDEEESGQRVFVPSLLNLSKSPSVSRVQPEEVKAVTPTSSMSGDRHVATTTIRLYNEGDEEEPAIPATPISDERKDDEKDGKRQPNKVYKYKDVITVRQESIIYPKIDDNDDDDEWDAPKEPIKEEDEEDEDESSSAPESMTILPDESSEPALPRQSSILPFSSTPPISKGKSKGEDDNDQNDGDSNEQIQQRNGLNSGWWWLWVVPVAIIAGFSISKLLK